MRKRHRRRQQEKAPTTSVDSSEAKHCLSSSSSLAASSSYFVLLLFLLLLSAAVAAFFNSAFSHYPGGYLCSFPWLSGVHADINDGEHGKDQDGFILPTQDAYTSLNRTEPVDASVETHTVKYLVPFQDRKCKDLSLRDLITSIRLPICCCRLENAKRKRRHSQCAASAPSSSFYSKVSSSEQSTLSSIINVTNFDAGCSKSELPNFQEAGKEYAAQEDDRECRILDDQENVTPDTSEDTSEECNAFVDSEDQSEVAEMVLLEKNMDSSNINHDEDNQSSGHFLQDTISAPAKQNGENESSIEKKSDTFSPTNDANVNGSMSVLVKSDILNKMHSSLTNLSRVHLRQEPGDGPYNYASDLKGAKILASNQEAKGASNILNRDRDKYFRTPCSIESKYVDMELAEETLVVEIILANHEFYSSNVREFAVWGSLIYPTDEWILLGKFEAENSRVSQVFILKEPQWVRYMKLQMLSHYGTDFYCTLSTLEVHGVDAIEWILEDWIAEELGESHSQSSSIKDEDSSHVDKDLVSLSSTQTHVISQDSKPEEEIDIMLNQNLEDCSVESSVDVPEKKSKPMEKSQPVYHQTGRPGLDAVMKLLMQKVRTLEQKQPSLSRSLNDLDIQQREIFKAHSDEVTMMMSKVEDQGFEIGNLSLLLQSMERQWKRERDTLEGDVLNRIQAWNMDFESLRACGSPMLAVWLNVKP